MTQFEKAEKAMKKQKAIGAIKILNEFVGDLFVASNLPKLAEKLFPENSHNRRILMKIADAHIVLTLYKFTEWHNCFGKQLLPINNSNKSKALFNELKDKRIKKLRDELVAHIIDKDTGEPLTLKKMQSLFEQSGFTSVNDLAIWVKKRCIPTIESLRSALKNHWSLNDHEIFADEKRFIENESKKHLT